MRNILVIRFGSLGDVVLTLPAIEALRAAYPAAQVRVAVKQEYASLFAGSASVDGVVPLESNGVHRGLAGLRRYARRLREEPLDLVVDLHGSARSRMLTRFLGDVEVVRASLHHLRRRALVRFKRPLLGYPGHIVDRYLAALGRVAGCPEDRRPRLSLAEDTRAQMAPVLEELGRGSDRELVVLAPGAGRATKRWPPERFGFLARRLVEETESPVVVIGSDGEGALVERVVRQAGSSRVSAHCSSDLMRQAVLLAAASVLVTNDSGLMHVSVAVGTPVVAIFGSTTEALGFYPLGDQDVALSVPLACRPCGLHGLDRCPRGDLACMEQIGVDRVFDAVAAAQRLEKA